MEDYLYIFFCVEEITAAKCKTECQHFSLDLRSFLYKNIFYKNIEAEICEIFRMF